MKKRPRRRKLHALLEMRRGQPRLRLVRTTLPDLESLVLPALTENFVSDGHSKPEARARIGIELP